MNDGSTHSSHHSFPGQCQPQSVTFAMRWPLGSSALCWLHTHHAFCSLARATITLGLKVSPKTQQFRLWRNTLNRCLCLSAAIAFSRAQSGASYCKGSPPVLWSAVLVSAEPRFIDSIPLNGRMFDRAGRSRRMTATRWRLLSSIRGVL